VRKKKEGHEMPPGGGGGGGGDVRVGMRRAKFRAELKYWIDVYDHCERSYRRWNVNLTRLTIFLSLGVSGLSLMSTTLGAGGPADSPADVCEDVPSQCYVDRAADVLMAGTCGNSMECAAGDFSLENEAAEDESDAESESESFVQQVGGVSGLLSLIAGGLSLVITTLATCASTLKWGARAEAFAAASHRLGLLTIKLDGLSRQNERTRFTEEVWRELDDEYTEVLDQLHYKPTKGEEKAARPDGKPADTVLPPNLVSFADELEEIGIQKEESQQWLDGDIEAVLKDHDIDLPQPLLRDLRDKSRRAFPQYLGKKMDKGDVLEKVKQQLGLTDEAIRRTMKELRRKDLGLPLTATDAECEEAEVAALRQHTASPSRPGRSSRAGTLNMSSPTTPQSPALTPPSGAARAADDERVTDEDVIAAAETSLGITKGSPDVGKRLQEITDRLYMHTGWEPQRLCKCLYAASERGSKEHMLVPRWQCSSLSNECMARPVLHNA
jgi:hypothetical protein